ncbi:MAG: SDR family NAD(P)-dependent oxidoreductase [Chloroflexi bacterium]|nr:SDR family NAD(P)-dependent oxidoreductase [Chloroflexota bacterium]
MLSPKGSNFGATTTAEEVLKNTNLTGRIAVVTGASGGIGKETARALAVGGATVVLAARDVAKTERAAAEIVSATGNPSVETLRLDLASQADVRRAAAEYLDRHDVLHILINNAGIMACPELKTEDGIDLQFGVCHIGHFLFTCLLAPALIRGAPSRVVNLSSGGHRFAPVDFDDINFNQRKYDKWIAYGQAKTATALFSVELNRRLSPQGVSAFAVHPGLVYGTDLPRHMDKSDLAAISRMISGNISPKTVAQGAATSVWAAVSGDLDGKGGSYLEDCSIGELNDAPQAQSGYRSWALDPIAAARLWEKSEELVKERFF